MLSGRHVLLKLHLTTFCQCMHSRACFPERYRAQCMAQVCMRRDLWPCCLCQHLWCQVTLASAAGGRMDSDEWLRGIETPRSSHFCPYWQEQPSPDQFCNFSSCFPSYGSIRIALVWHLLLSFRQNLVLPRCLRRPSINVTGLYCSAALMDLGFWVSHLCTSLGNNFIDPYGLERLL